MFIFKFCSFLMLTSFLAQGYGAPADLQVDGDIALGFERELKHASIPVRLIELNNGKASVVVSQAVIGDQHNCMNGAESTVQVMFATYLNPDTLEPACGAFKRNADACYTKQLWIGCDPETKIASIDVYYKDESYDLSMSTDNPKIGRCKVGKKDTIKRASKFTATFDCDPSASGGPDLCSDSVDNCPEGSYCIFTGLGYQCKKYARVGDSCGGLIAPSVQGVCNPEVAYCLNLPFCHLPDTPGVCTAYRGDCESDKDCSDSTQMYCDQSEGKCKDRFKLGDCCDSSTQLCVKGLECDLNGDKYYCQRPGGSGGPALEICNNQACGGLFSLDCECACDKGSPTCVLYPTELCDPAQGAADCGGVCECKSRKH